MRYLIIGLGIYGSNLARDLVAMGHEVIGADSSRVTVDAIKDYITTAYVIDTTEETSLGVLPLRNVDIVIVAIGENFGASVKTVALLKKNGVRTIFARAIDPLHESILESFHVARILRPEQRAARDLTREMVLGSTTESLELTDDSYVIKFTAPSTFVGQRYDDIELDKDGNLKLIAVTRPRRESSTRPGTVSRKATYGWSSARNATSRRFTRICPAIKGQIRAGSTINHSCPIIARNSFSSITGIPRRVAFSSFAGPMFAPART